MKRNKKHNIKNKWNTELCGIKKSIKEEKAAIVDKLKYRECFKIEEETTQLDKVLYWLFFGLGALLCIYLFSKGISNKVVAFGLIYLMLNLFLGALFYTCRREFARKLYVVISKPLRILFTYFFKLLRINYIVQYSLKCFVALVASVFIGIHVLLVLPNCIPPFGDVITAVFPNAKVASHMCILCMIIISMIVGRLVMYIFLRAMLVVFVSGDRKSKLDIFGKIWKEMKLLFYLFATILQFWGMVEGVLDMEVQYLLEAVLFTMVIDEYIGMRNE